VLASTPLGFFWPFWPAPREDEDGELAVGVLAGGVVVLDELSLGVVAGVEEVSVGVDEESEGGLLVSVGVLVAGSAGVAVPVSVLPEGSVGAVSAKAAVGHASVIKTILKLNKPFFSASLTLSIPVPPLNFIFRSSRFSGEEELCGGALLPSGRI
jgi:hypothetical protein